MKRTVIVLILCVLLHDLNAQSKTNKPKSNSGQNTRKTTAGAKADTASVSLGNTGRYNAFGSSNAAGLRISDPTIIRLNQRASGADVPLSGSGIAGMPKGSYGFAKGKILLRNTTSTTPGTGYGSGAVGTGTSLQGPGTAESAIGVNGKSPYAGPWLWGDRRPLLPQLRADSARRQ